MKRPGVFITFEGGEGVGKTTQIRLLAQRLRLLGKTVVTTLEPGGTELGKILRKLLVCETNDPPSPRAELMLYCADRAHHVEKVIEPALNRGDVVLCDRFSDATLAYQGYGRGIDIDLIYDLNKIATKGIAPDRTIWLDVDPKKGLGRAIERMSADGCLDESRFENEKLDFHLKVRKGYESRMVIEPQRFRRIEADRPIEDVEKLIWSELGDLFGGTR